MWLSLFDVTWLLISSPFSGLRMKFSTKHFCFSCKSPLLKHFPAKLWHNCVTMCVRRVCLTRRHKRDRRTLKWAFVRMDSAPLKVREAPKGRKLIYITVSPITGVDRPRQHSHAANVLKKQDLLSNCPDVICNTLPWQHVVVLFREVQWNVPGWYRFSFLCKPRCCLHSKCQWEALTSWTERNMTINRILQFRFISESKRNTAIYRPLNEQQGPFRSSWVDKIHRNISQSALQCFCPLSKVRELLCFFWCVFFKQTTDAVLEPASQTAPSFLFWEVVISWSQRLNKLAPFCLRWHRSVQTSTGLTSTRFLKTASTRLIPRNKKNGRSRKEITTCKWGYIGMCFKELF